MTRESLHSTSCTPVFLEYHMLIFCKKMIVLWGVGKVVGQQTTSSSIKDDLKDFSKVFQEWLHWQVTYQTVLENVSFSTCVTTVPQTLKISLVLVKYPNS